jgi:hypothetical protein
MDSPKLRLGFVTSSLPVSCDCISQSSEADHSVHGLRYTPRAVQRPFAKCGYLLRDRLDDPFKHQYEWQEMLEG